MSELDAKLQEYRPTPGRAQATYEQIGRFSGVRIEEQRPDERGRPKQIRVSTIGKDGRISASRLWVRIDVKEQLYERIEGSDEPGEG